MYCEIYNKMNRIIEWSINSERPDEDEIDEIGLDEFVIMCFVFFFWIVGISWWAIPLRIMSNIKLYNKSIR